MTAKTLDIKLAKIHADPNCREFIIADAKDADMAFGIASPGKSPEHHAQEGKFRSLAEYRENIRQVVAQGLVDIMLMSAHTNSILTIEERLFDSSHVTPAARANDTTDIHVVREGTYPKHPSQPFQSTTIDHIQCGKYSCEPHERAMGADLGLYSVTFNNDLAVDQRTLETYKKFRLEAEARGFRHFLEVFDPNKPVNPIDSNKLGGFINDMIVRSLAGVPVNARPVFLKMVYHGPKATEELASYDPHLVIGILGGSSGTTYDAFKLISEAQKYGAKVALFGRKINNAEHQLAFIEMLRRIVDGQISPEEAVRAYHGVLQGVGIKPYRSLEDDLQATSGVMSYGGSSQTRVPAGNGASNTRSSGNGQMRTSNTGATARPKAAPPQTPASATPSQRQAQTTEDSGRMVRSSRDALAAGAATPLANGAPDFSKMTAEQKLAYHRMRISQM